MDIESFVDWYLINEISKNNDATFAAFSIEPSALHLISITKESIPSSFASLYNFTN